MPRSIFPGVLIVIHGCVCSSPGSRAHGKRKSHQSSAHSSQSYNLLKPVLTDVFVLIPRFLTREERMGIRPPTNKLLITMTHVCRLWRIVLSSAPSLWTLIDFSVSAKPQQAEVFIHRLGLAPESKYFEIKNRSQRSQTQSSQTFWRTNAKIHESLVTLVPHKPS